MLQALGILAGAYKGYQQGLENRQIRQLRDLQAENYRLRNESARLDNDFARDTFGYRLDQERGNANYELGRGRKTLAEARQEEEIERQGLRVSQEQGKDRYEHNRADYWGSAAVEAASDANVAVQTEQSRIEKIHSEAEKAYQDAVRSGISTRSEASTFFGARLSEKLGERSLPEALEDPSVMGDIRAQLEVQFDHLLSPGQRIAQLVYNDEAGGYMVATQMPDGSFKPITRNRSSDPDDPPMVFSPEEVEGVLLGEAAGDYRTLQAQRQLATGAVSSQAEGIRRQHAEDTTTAAQRRMQAGEQAIQSEKLRQTLADLRARREELVAQNGRVSVPNGVGTIRGGVASGVQMVDNSSQIEAVDTAIEEIESSYQQPLSRTPDEWRSEQAAMTDYLASGDERLTNTLRNLGGAANEARLVSQASGGEIPVNQAVDNTLGRGPSLASLTPTERVQNQADVAQANDTIMASVEDTFDRALETLQDSVDARELAERGMKQDDLSRVARSAWASMFNSEGHTDLISAASGSPRDRIGVQVLLAAAANDAMYQGGDAGRFIKETLRGASPAVIRMASEFTNDDAFAGVPDGERLRAVDRAVQLMEDYNLNATQAKTRALQEMREGRG